MAQERGVKPFLQQVAAHLLTHYSDRLEKEVLVLPGKRAARFLQRYLGIESGGWIWSPRVMTMEEFIQNSHPSAPADPIATYFDLYEVYAHELGLDASNFASFIKWGKTLLQDLEEVDRYMVPPEKIFSDLRKIKEIEEWSFDREELSPYQSRYLDLWMKLGKVHRGLKDALASKGQVLKGEAYRSLGAKPQLAEPWAEEGHIHFIGLNALSKAEEAVIGHLVKEGKAVLHFDADPYYMDDPAQEAGFFLRQYRKRAGWKEGFAYRSGPLGGGKRKINAIGVNGRVAQAKLAGRILEKEAPDEGALRSAVVLPDENLLQPVLHSIPSSVGSLNVTMGFPLARTALHALFQDLLRTHRYYHQAREEGGRAGFYHRDLIRVLEHPYIDALFQERIGVSSRHSVEIMRERNQRFLERDEVLENIRKSAAPSMELPDALLALFTPFEQMPKGALALQEQVLDALQGVMQERGDSLDRENLFEYARVLKRLRDLFDEGYQVASIEAYERLLGQVVEGEELSFTGEPLQGVQVMGMLETRAIDLSHIVLLSANETLLPKSHPEASLIPQDLRSYYKMPVRHEKDAVFAYHFYRMIQRADRVDLLYDSDPEGAGSGEKSRFLTQLLHEAPEKDEKTEIRQWSAYIPLPKNDRGSLSFNKDERVLERLREWAGRGISPTAISTWVEDPYRFYRKYVLGLPEPEELAESIDARSLGDLIHNTLYDLYREYEGKELPSKEIGEMEKQVEAMVRARFEEHYRPKDIDSGKNLIMFRVIRERVERFLRMEQRLVQREEEKGRSLFIESLETPFSTEWELDVKGERVKLCLRGTADRIDRIGDTVRLIDLKTGTVDHSKLNIGDPKELFEDPGYKYALQLLFYGSIYLREFGPENPEKVKPSIIGFRDLGNGPMGLSQKRKTGYGSFEELIRAFEEQLGEELQQILDPELPIEERS